MGIGIIGCVGKSSSQCTIRRICEELDSILALYLVPRSRHFHVDDIFAIYSRKHETRMNDFENKLQAQ
jgi:hypothetical protein